MEEALVSYLAADVGLTALVGDRITWKKATQGKVNPYVVLHKIDGLRESDMDGFAGLITARVQVDCWGLTYLSAKSVARAVEARLRNFRGTHAGQIFYGCFVESERDVEEETPAPDDVFGVSLDFIIHYKGA
jgi:hypothetical protein